MAPAIAEAVKVKVCPGHNGPLLATVGADGVGFTVIRMESVLVQPAASATVK